MDNKEYIESLKSFIKHLESTKNTLMDNLYLKQEKYDNKFDITISINNKTITIPNNADSFSRLNHMIEEELKEECNMIEYHTIKQEGNTIKYPCDEQDIEDILDFINTLNL